MGKTPKPKVLLWDIESSDFAADYGFVFCISYKWLGDKQIHTIAIRDTKEFKNDVTDDRGVIDAFRKVMEQADYQVTWYGERFDFPFINTRALCNAQKPLPLVPHADGWRTARKKMRFQSNRLDGISRAIPVAPGKKRELKNYIGGRHWVRAKAGYKDALAQVEKHCVADIRILENVYLALRPYAVNPPNLSKVVYQDIQGCPACGCSNIQKRGYAVTAHGRRQRMHCQDCGHWFSTNIKTEAEK